MFEHSVIALKNKKKPKNNNKYYLLILKVVWVHKVSSPTFYIHALMTNILKTDTQFYLLQI